MLRCCQRTGQKLSSGAVPGQTKVLTLEIPVQVSRGLNLALGEIERSVGRKIGLTPVHLELRRCRTETRTTDPAREGVAVEIGRYELKAVY